MAILTTGPTTAYAAGSGSNPTNLGCWCWTQYCSTKDHHFLLFSIYCPNHNVIGQLSVYAQHQRYFQDTDNDRDPIHAFFEDLATAIADWQALGDLVIVCGDINHDVLHPTITNYFHQLGLHNLIFSHHNPSNAPATYARNQNNISIDDIWGPSFLLYHSKVGYLDFNIFLGDHHALWFDLIMTNFLDIHYHLHEAPQFATFNCVTPDACDGITRS